MTHGLTHTHDHAHQHPPTGRAWLRVSLWLSLSLLALWVLLHGQTTRYIAPNVAWTLWLAVLVALTLAALDGYSAWARGDLPLPAWERLRRFDIGGWRNLGYAIAFLPFITGIVVAPSVLGAGSILANAGVVTLLPAPVQGDATPPNVAALSLLQLQDRLRAGAPLASATVVGFAFHQPGLPGGEWLLTRFITPHCVAEAQPIALVVRAASGRAPPDNTWLRLTGPLTAGVVNGRSVAILVPTTQATIAAPRDPYLIY